MKKQGLVLSSILALLLVVILAVFVVEQQAKNRTVAGPDETSEFLHRDYVQAKGQQRAKVTIVEFLDPACEACRAFYPFVNDLLQRYKGQVKLEARFVPFHRGADEVVEVLNATVAQQKFWQSLHVALQYQEQWTANHVASVDKLLPFLADIGVDLDQLAEDRKSGLYKERMAQDLSDAKALAVAKTPTFFVNGRAMSQFGYQQLEDLVAEEVAKHYPQQQ
jgi:protein-disulfide isomerase